MADPPLMFWHTAAALQQQYWLLPVPQAYWMQEAMQVRCMGGTSAAAAAAACCTSRVRCMAGGPALQDLAAPSQLTAVRQHCPPQVPVDEVVDILTAALAPKPPSPPACIPGTYADTRDGPARCTACAAGTYAFNAGAAACKPCAAGRVASALGSAACRTCQPGTYSSADGRACLPCPEGELAGACCFLGPLPCVPFPAARVATHALGRRHAYVGPHLPQSPAGTFSLLPGAWSVAQCLTPEQRRHEQEGQAASVQLLR